MLPNFVVGDAIGHSVLTAQRYLRKLGFESEVFADVFLENVRARNYREFAFEGRETWLLYHYSTGSVVNSFALENSDNIVLCYHNITPPEFFRDFDQLAEKTCREGREVLKRFSGRVRYAMADSEYNAIELEGLGIGPVEVVPPILDFDQIRPTGNNPFGDDKTNILFVSRVAPNKRCEDILKVFHFYRRYVNTNSRLTFVGGYGKNDRYYRYLRRIIETMNIPDVVFTGFVPNEKVGDYYANASVFLCMSRHEGFGVPLLEAMNFRVPVVALSCAGIPYTMGSAGILVSRNEPEKIAELLGVLVDDNVLREQIIEGQLARLADFSDAKTEASFKRVIDAAMNGSG